MKKKENKQIELKTILFSTTNDYPQYLFTQAFITGNFDVSQYDPTIEDSYKKTLEVNKKKVCINVMETSGLENFTTMKDLYIKDAHISVVLIDPMDYDAVSKAWDIVDNIKRVQDKGEDKDNYHIVPVIIRRPFNIEVQQGEYLRG